MKHAPMDALLKLTPRLFIYGAIILVPLHALAGPTNQHPVVAWGVPAHGFQLGIRFSKASFSAGEPIEATILLRNVAATNLPSGFSTAGGLNGAFYDGYGIVVTTGTNVVPSLVNRITDPWSPALGTGSAISFEISPGEVREHTIRLDKEFSLKPEMTYTVTATRGVRRLKGTGTAEIKTGKATLKIVPPPATTNEIKR